MAGASPPGYAWDWVARQRLVWRAARARLASGDGPEAARYAAVQDRADVLPLLRADYPSSDEVRRSLHAAISEIAFGGRTDVPFAQVGFRTSPRGLRWWWTAVTGEELDRPTRRTEPVDEPAPPQQLTLPELAELDPRPALDDVAKGYGDRAH